MIDSSPSPSSSSSAESSFRELDEVFLQTQTRIWLGELLNIRLDEDSHLPDLLQDGEILFEVSKVLWDLLLTKCVELKHLKHKYGPFRSKRSSGRYRPYSNVDSFLKICEILGLSGIDLFSPSDVVEKRDIRKVCICLRALSRKARSKLLSVPDFDMVVYSITMPTDMVGVIRKSLESSQCTFSSSSSYSPCKGSKRKLKQEELYTLPNGDDDSSSSEESDEAESRYMGENSFSSANKLEYADGINSDSENSPETYPKLHSDISHISSKEKQNCENDNIDVALENDGCFTGNSSCIDVGENNYISDYLAFTDLMVHATNDSAVLDGENNMFDFFLTVDSQRGNSDKRGGSERVYSDDDDISSTTSMSSVLDRLLNLEFDNQSDEDVSSSTNIHSSVLKEDESEKHVKDLFVSSEPPTEDDQSHAAEHFLPSQDKCETFCVENLKDESHGTQLGHPRNDDCQENEGVVVANDNHEIPPSCEVEVKETVGTTMLDSDSIQGFSSQEYSTHVFSDDANVQTNLHETMAENHHCSSVVDMKITQDVAKNCGQDNREDSEGCVPEIVSDGRKDTSNSQLSTKKHSRTPLLKKVFQGTAIAGACLLLLHFSKSRGNNALDARQNGRVSKNNGLKSSPVKQQIRRAGNGVYPAEKIRL